MSEPDRLKVLIIDSSASIRRSLHNMLSTLFDLSEVSDGLEGIGAYHSFAPDIIILDMNMPRKSGLEVIEHVRVKAVDEDTYILMLTTEETSKIKSKALNAGANDYLTKPFDTVELLARVGVADRHVRLTRKLRGAYATIREEIDTVAQLQRSLLPSGDRLGRGVSVTSFYQPSTVASGDYFDYFPLDGGASRLLIADVSGHGARAAFLMAMVRSLFRTTSVYHMGLAETLTLINNQLLEILGGEPDFVSIFAADIHPGGHLMEYVNAGHCPGILYQGGELMELAPQTTVVGFFEIDFPVTSVALKKPAELFLFTDGWYEWTVSSGDMYGLDRFMDAVKKLFLENSFSFEALYRALCSELADRYSERPNFRDDLSALWVRVHA